MKHQPVMIILCMFIATGFTYSNGQTEENKQVQVFGTHYGSMKDKMLKVDTLLATAEKFAGNKPDTFFHLSHQALTIVQNIGYAEGKSMAFNNLAEFHKKRGHIDSSIYFLRKHISVSEVLNNDTAIGKGYLNLGNQLLRKGDKEESHENFIKAMELFNKIGHNQGLISVFNSLGTFYKNQSQLDSAIYYYLKTLRLCDEYKFRKGIGPTMTNLGNLYLQLDDYEKSKLYSLESIPYSLEFRNYGHVAIAYTNIGNVEARLKHYDSSLVYFGKALEIQKKLQDQLGINNTYINQGMIYREKGEYRKAIENFDLSLQSHTKIGYSSGYITALFNKAGVLSKLGMHADAEALLDSSLRMAVKLNNLSLQIEILKKHIENFVKQGNYRKAFDAQNSYYQISDSIIKLEKKSDVHKLTIEYEKEKDQAKILALINENLAKDLRIRKSANQRNIYLFAGSAGVLAIFFVLLFFRIKTRNERFQQIQKIRQLEKDKKLMSVQFLMEGQEEERKRIAKELHDGLGVLLSTAKMQFSSIRDALSENNVIIEKATGLLEMAAGEVRKISHNMMPGLLSKYGFFEAVEDLIEQINDAGIISAIFTINGQPVRFSDKTEFMLYRIVQELINNTIKHADARHINLNASIYQDSLELIYSDDGKGFDMQEAMSNNCFGLRSIQSRINYMGGRIKIETAPGKGVKFTIIVQLDNISQTQEPFIP
jgi:two-component system, NarL family, sensor kinase